MAAISVRESGGDYTTLEAAVENASTVDGDVITISGTWSSREDTRIAVADALTIQATGDSKHYGRAWQTGDTHYQHRSTSNTSGDHSFTITDTGSIVFDGLDIQHAGTGVSNEIFRNNVSNTLLVKNSVLGFNSRTDQQDIYYNEQVANVTFENCMFYNAYRAVVDLYNHANGSVVNINSCISYDCGNTDIVSSRSGIVGIFGTNTCTVNLFNCIFDLNAGLVVNSTDNNTSVNAHTVITNVVNILSVTYTTFTTNTNNVTSATITDSTASTAYILRDTTTSPYDLRLTDHANNTAQDNHTNGTGTGTGLSVPSVDIIGTSRPQNTNYDIGAFEIVVAAGDTITASLTSGSVTVYNPSLSAGVVTLSPGLVSSIVSVLDISLTSALALNLSLTEASASVGAVSQSSAYNVMPNAANLTASVNTVAIPYEQFVSPNIVSLADLVNQPMLLTGENVLPSAVLASVNVGAVSLVSGAITILPTLLYLSASVNNPRLFDPSLTVGGFLL